MNYTYLVDGEVDHEDYANGVRSDLGYDGRGFINLIRTYRQSSPQETYSKREYWRDNRDRITAWKRGVGGGPNGMEDGRGDRYGYDAEGQLTEAVYRAFIRRLLRPVMPSAATPFTTTNWAAGWDQTRWPAGGRRPSHGVTTG